MRRFHRNLHKHHYIMKSPYPNFTTQRSVGIFIRVPDINSTSPLFSHDTTPLTFFSLFSSFLFSSHPTLSPLIFFFSLSSLLLSSLLSHQPLLHTFPISHIKKFSNKNICRSHPPPNTPLSPSELPSKI
jgi:hypothetical protein